MSIAEEHDVRQCLLGMALGAALYVGWQVAAAARALGERVVPPPIG